MGFRRIAAIRAALSGGVFLGSFEDGQPLRFGEPTGYDETGKAAMAARAARAALSKALTPATTRLSPNHFQAWSSETPAYRSSLEEDGLFDQAAYAEILLSEAAGGSFQGTEAYIEAVKRTVSDVHRACGRIAGDLAAAAVNRFTPDAFRSRMDDWKKGADGQTLAWAIAHDLIGEPGHGQAVLYRMQALSVYGVVKDVLQHPDVTARIDAGQRINPKTRPSRET